MKPLPDQFPEGMKRALTALYGPHTPMTPAEQAEYDRLREREMARAETRRNPTQAGGGDA